MSVGGLPSLQIARGWLAVFFQEKGPRRPAFFSKKRRATAVVKERSITPAIWMWACKARRELTRGGVGVDVSASCRTGAGTSDVPSCKAVMASEIILTAPKRRLVTADSGTSVVADVAAFHSTRSMSRQPD